MREDFSFFTSSGNKIRVSLFSDKSRTSKPCLILVHGFKGFKDWGFWPYTAEFFSKNGFNVFSFNFSHNGVGESLTEFDEIEKFAKNTVSLEISELNEVIDKIINSQFYEINCKELGIIGHSRGGAVSLLVSSRNKYVKSVALWASISKLDRYTERQKAEWKEKGFLEVLNTRTNQLMRLNVDLLYDIEQNKNTSLNIEWAVKNLNKPLLIVHGEQDLTVPIQEANQIYEWSDKNLTVLKILKATGHTFDVVHPFTGTNKKFEEVLSITLNFFRKTLLSEQ